MKPSETLALFPFQKSDRKYLCRWHGFGGVGNPLVVDADGDFLTYVTPGVSQAVFATPWSFNSGAVTAFWSVGGFTFNLVASSIFSQGGNPAGVVVTGYGFITGNGFDATFGTWSFSTQDPSAGPILLFGGERHRA